MWLFGRKGRGGPQVGPAGWRIEEGKGGIVVFVGGGPVTAGWRFSSVVTRNPSSLNSGGWWLDQPSVEGAIPPIKRKGRVKGIKIKNRFMQRNPRNLHTFPCRLQSTSYQWSMYW